MCVALGVRALLRCACKSAAWPWREKTHGARQKRLEFGQYGEASPDVHGLLTIAARRMAEQEWHELGARRAEKTRGEFCVDSHCKL